jgi:hypothetical protein
MNINDYILTLHATLNRLKIKHHGSKTEKQIVYLHNLSFHPEKTIYEPTAKRLPLPRKYKYTQS